MIYAHVSCAREADEIRELAIANCCIIAVNQAKIRNVIDT